MSTDLVIRTREATTVSGGGGDPPKKPNDQGKKPPADKVGNNTNARKSTKKKEKHSCFYCHTRGHRVEECPLLQSHAQLQSVAPEHLELVLRAMAARNRASEAGSRRAAFARRRASAQGEGKKDEGEKGGDKDQSK